MADGVLVVVLLVFIWAAVLVAPAASARASREAEFLGSIRPDSHPLDSHAFGPSGRTGEIEAFDAPRFRPALTANARRRQVLGGLMVAIGVTLVLGLLPTFRILLVVHLLLVNSCLAYVGLLVHLRDQQAIHDGLAPAGWRDEARRTARLVEADPGTHPYAASDVDEDTGSYRYDLAASYSDYEGTPASAPAGGYDGWAGDDRVDDGWVDDGWVDDEWADDDTEAAYVDDELALGLARPA